MPTVVVAQAAGLVSATVSATIHNVIDRCTSAFASISEDLHVIWAGADNGWNEALYAAYRHLSTAHTDLAALQILLIMASPPPMNDLLAVSSPSFPARINAFVISEPEFYGAQESIPQSLTSFCYKYGGTALSVAATWDTTLVTVAVDALFAAHYSSGPLPLHVGSLSVDVTLSPSPLQFTPEAPASILEVLGFMPADRAYVAGAEATMAVAVRAGDTGEGVFSALMEALRSQRVVAVVLVGRDRWGALTAREKCCLQIWPRDLAASWTTQLTGQSLLSIAPSYSMDQSGVTVSVEAVNTRIKKLSKLCQGLPDDGPELVNEINSLLGAARLLGMSDQCKSIVEQFKKIKAPSPDCATIIANLQQQLEAKSYHVSLDKVTRSKPSKRASIDALLNDD